MRLSVFLTIMLAFAALTGAVLTWGVRTGGRRRLWWCSAALCGLIVVASVIMTLGHQPFSLPTRAVLMSFIPWLGVPVVIAALLLHFMSVRGVRPAYQWAMAAGITLATLPIGLSLALLLSDFW